MLERRRAGAISKGPSSESQKDSPLITASTYNISYIINSMEDIMSKLGYFLGGMLAGATALGIVAWASTEYSGACSASRLAGLDDGCLGEGCDAEDGEIADAGSACVQGGDTSDGSDGSGGAASADCVQPQPA